MGKMLLILTLAMAGIFSVINLNMTHSNRKMIVNSVTDYERAQAKNLAASGIEIASMQIKQDTTWSGMYQQQIGGGYLNISVTNTNSMYPSGPSAGIRAKEIVSTGNVNNQSVAIRAVVEIQSSGGVANVRAAITTNNPVQTLGGLQVDGREHDINGNLIDNSGTLAISTTQTVTQGGSSDFFGTYDGADQGPIDKFGDNSDIIEENAIWEDGFPATPDSFMGGVDAGYPEGTLISMALSGANGSQYVTNPNDLSFPLSGVTYVEMPTGPKEKDRTWKSIDFGTSSGILVVHNSAKNAIMKNLNSGTFTGLIITDDIIHIHCTIIGAVVALSPNPSAGNCIGNGNGSVKYSSAAINNAASGGGGSGSSYTVSLVSWYE